MTIGIVPALQRTCMKLPLPQTLKNFMAHPAGLFTSKWILLIFRFLIHFFIVFFWAPTFKWAITFSNIGDMKKPA